MPDAVFTAVMEEAEAYEAVRHAARETLAQWPAARAAVLFGSRARGDHRPDSDWDIAFLTAADNDRLSGIPGGLPIETLPLDVQAHAVPEALPCRRALWIGDVGRGIARDGQLLAGCWTRPDLKGEPSMTPDEYGALLGSAVTHIEYAALNVAKAGKNWFRTGGACDHFVAATADAAERLAKAMLGRHGVDYRRTHDCAVLAGYAEAAGRGELAERIHEMNGSTKDHHTAGYHGASEEDLKHAVKRLPAVLRNLEEELIAAEQSPTYEEFAAHIAADQLVEDIKTGLANLREAEARDDSPAPPERAWMEVLTEHRKDLIEELEGLLQSFRPPDNSNDDSPQ